jgi:membrane-bound metal-dependent hydrolase YbcI (DUF457 family)
VGIVAGSVLPDLDALYRLADKVPFLRAHQSWSHALPVQLVLSIALGLAATLLGWRGIDLGAGLLAGLIAHSLLDLTNTYGVALLMPFSRRRFCLEWVFFIDLVVLAGTAATLALVIPLWLRQGEVPAQYAVAFLVGLCAYALLKGALRHRVGRLCPQAKSLVPSASVPWRFFGAQRREQTMSLFRVNALTGSRCAVGEVPVLDDSFALALNGLPEFRLMRELSPEYHVVGASADGASTRLLCRDLRMRNFRTRFGDLEVWLDSNQQVLHTRFHV